VIKHTLLALVFGLALCVTASAQMFMMPSFHIGGGSPTPPVVIPTLNSHTAAAPKERRGQGRRPRFTGMFTRLPVDGSAVRFHFLYGLPTRFSTVFSYRSTKRRSAAIT
jgi:hypothetical protein